MSSPHSTLDCIPGDLVDLITRHVPDSSTRQSLFRATRIFCQQPTSEFVTGLRIALPQLDRHRLGRLARSSATLLPRVEALMICGPASSSRRSIPVAQLTSTLLPSLPFLTKLELHRLSWTAVRGAVTLLSPAACPLLAHIRLQQLHPGDIREVQDAAKRRLLDSRGKPKSEDGGKDEDDDAPDQRRLFSALSTFSSLRHLEISCDEPDGFGCDWGGDAGVPAVLWLYGVTPTWEWLGAVTPLLEGLGAVTQLRSLSLRYVTLPLPELSQLVALTTLTLDHAHLEAATPVPATPALATLVALQCLRLVVPEPDNAPTYLADFAPCVAFTSLHITALRHDEGDAELWDVVATTYTRLVRLDFNLLEVDSTQLPALPALRQLCCGTLTLPPAGAGVALQLMRSVTCDMFCFPHDDLTGAPLPSQALAQTFPRLVALTWRGMWPMWPASGPVPPVWDAMLPTAAAERLLHLTALSATLTSPFRGHCAVGLQRLTVRSSTRHVGGRTLADFIRDLQPAGADLRHLELSGKQISDAGLALATDAWPSVEEVTLVHAKGVTDAGLVALSRLPRLRRVSLLRCPAVTVKGVAAMAERWSVECVRVRACAKVGERDVWRLHHRLARPHLDLLHS